VTHEFFFNSGGGAVTAALFGSAPLVILIVAWRQGATRRLSRAWQISKHLYGLPLIVLLLGYYALLYWWLFYDQFYRLEVQPGGFWKLEYRLPARDKIIATRDIADLVLESGDLRTHRMTRLVIITADGKHYPSAQITERQAKEYRAILARFRQEQREQQ
jgi:hypothetical protein